MPVCLDRAVIVTPSLKSLRISSTSFSLRMAFILFSPFLKGDFILAAQDTLQKGPSLLFLILVCSRYFNRLNTLLHVLHVHRTISLGILIPINSFRDNRELQMKYFTYIFCYLFMF